MPRTKKELVFADPPNADTPVDKNLLKTKVKRGQSFFVEVDGKERRICTHESYLNSQKFYFIKGFSPVPKEEIGKIENMNGKLSLSGKTVINHNAYKLLQKQKLIPQKPKKIIPKRNEYVFAEGENKGKLIPKELLDERVVISGSSYIKYGKKLVKICTYGQYLKLTTQVEYKGVVMSKSTYENKKQREKGSKIPQKSQGKTIENLNTLDDDDSDYEAYHQDDSDHKPEQHRYDDKQKSTKQSSNQNKRKIREFDRNQTRQTQPQKKPKPQFLPPQKKPKPQYLESTRDKELVKLVEKPLLGENYKAENEEFKNDTARKKQTEAQKSVASDKEQTSHQPTPKDAPRKQAKEQQLPELIHSFSQPQHSLERPSQYYQREQHVSSRQQEKQQKIQNTTDDIANNQSGLTSQYLLALDDYQSLYYSLEDYQSLPYLLSVTGQEADEQGNDSLEKFNYNDFDNSLSLFPDFQYSFEFTPQSQTNTSLEQQTVIQQLGEPQQIQAFSYTTNQTPLVQNSLFSQKAPSQHIASKQMHLPTTQLFTQQMHSQPTQNTQQIHPQPTTLRKQ